MTVLAALVAVIGGLAGATLLRRAWADWQCERATLHVSLSSTEEAEANNTAYAPALHREWAADQNGKLIERRAPIANFLVALHVAPHLPRD